MALFSRRPAAAQVASTYAESVALFGATPDGSKEFSFRVGRFPGRSTGTLWASVYLGEDGYGAGVDDLDLGAALGTTPVEDDRVVFEVMGDATSRFERRGLGGEFSGEAVASVGAHPSFHPPVGPGDQPIRIEATFEAWHESVYPRSRRLEMMGSVAATIETPAGIEKIEGVGGWHEQVGERPRFAPAFTYFKAMGDHVGVLAGLRHGTGLAWGYAYLNGEVVGVEALEIDEQQRTREFRIRLDDGELIEGAAERIRQHSVPVEGQRRPGTTVSVSTNIGPLVGRLNDWLPRDA